MKSKLRKVIDKLDFVDDEWEMYEVAFNVETLNWIEDTQSPNSNSIKKDWYDLTYSKFIRDPNKCSDELVCYVAFAYSWMPTIPEIKSEPSWKLIKHKLSCFESHRSTENLKNLLIEFVPVFNNSIVGASKALHFMFPEDVAIVDSKIVKAWRSLFFNNRVHGMEGCPIAPFRSCFDNSSNQDRDINDFCKYCENLYYWSSATGKSIRNIELSLFKFEA